MAVRRRKFNTKKAGSRDDVVILDVNDDHSFKCASTIPGMLLVDFITMMDEDDPKSMGEGLQQFFTAALGENYEEFLVVTRDPENEIDINDLSEMAGWLAEQYSDGNPTVLSQLSSGGSDTTGLGNEELVSAGASI